MKYKDGGHTLISKSPFLWYFSEILDNTLEKLMKADDDEDGALSIAELSEEQELAGKTVLSKIGQKLIQDGKIKVEQDRTELWRVYLRIIIYESVCVLKTKYTKFNGSSMYHQNAWNTKGAHTLRAFLREAGWQAGFGRQAGRQGVHTLRAGTGFLLSECGLLCFTVFTKPCLPASFSQKCSQCVSALMEDIEISENLPRYWSNSHWYCSMEIVFSIDNSRTGLDTSKNQCSAPAVTALKNYWRYHVYNLFRLKNSSNVFALIIIIGCLTGNILLFWKRKNTRGWNVLKQTVGQDLAQQRRKKNWWRRESHLLARNMCLSFRKKK